MITIFYGMVFFFVVLEKLLGQCLLNSLGFEAMPFYQRGYK